VVLPLRKKPPVEASRVTRKPCSSSASTVGSATECSVTNTSNFILSHLRIPYPLRHYKALYRERQCDKRWRVGGAHPPPSICMQANGMVTRARRSIYSLSLSNGAKSAQHLLD